MPAERDVHYFSCDAASGMFRERGSGAPRSVRDWTHGQSGIFFFDTTDGKPPGALNRTPPVMITGGEWHTAGLIYLNSVSCTADSVIGGERVVLPPGEPYDDVDHDGAIDATETYVNLRYGTTIGSGAVTDEILKQSVATQSGSATSPDGETYSVATSLQTHPPGPPGRGEGKHFGGLYTSGRIG